MTSIKDNICIDKRVAELDPWSPTLTDAEKNLIIEEVRLNPEYFQIYIIRPNNYPNIPFEMPITHLSSEVLAKAEPPKLSDVLVKDYMTPRKISIEQLSEAIQVPVSILDDIIAERVSLDTYVGIRLAAAFGTRPAFWINMHHRRTLFEIITGKYNGIMRSIPVLDMVNEEK